MTAATVWIASYPKSGNTWVRFLLYSAIYGPPSRSIDIARRIPDIHRPTPTEPPTQGPSLAKTHFLLSESHPGIDETIGAIHIIRNPRDVLLSALHYHKLSKDRILGISSRRFATAFIEHAGNPEWLKPFGTWSEHARSWRETDRFETLALRYEDIKADPRAALDRMIDYLGLEVTPARRDAAVRASSFESMRELERREKDENPAEDLRGRLFVGTPRATNRGLYFINKGATNQSLEPIAPGLDARFDAAFRDELRRYGYAPRTQRDDT